MVRRFLLFTVFAVCILSMGCQTARNTGKGVALIGQGIAEDTRNCYDAAVKADKWLQDNYW